MSELLSTLDNLAATDLHQLPETTLLTETETLLDAKNRLDGLIAAHLQALDARDVTIAESGRHIRSWLIEDQHLPDEEAGQRLRVAKALPFHPAIGQAMLAGDVGQPQARLISHTLTRLTADWREAAEAELLTVARDEPMTTLAALCRALRIRTGADDDAEAQAQRLYDSRWATLSKSYQGMWHLTAMLDPEAGEVLATALQPLLTKTGPEDTRTTAQRRADALIDLARYNLDHGELPDHNGEHPQIMVTIAWNELRNDLTKGQLPQATINGKLAITPQTARRIACDAKIIPAVLGGNSEILDLGRSTRTWTHAQRRAARLRDKGCVFPNCQTGLDRCQLHHLKHWFKHHGPTDHHNSAHLCHFHHWLVHHTNWTITRNRDGKIEVRRT
jgi:hypothetical protein